MNPKLRSLFLVKSLTLLTDHDSAVVADAGFREEFVTNPHRLVMHRAQMAFDCGCAGVICSGKEVSEIKERFGKDFLAVTPGIRPSWSLTENDDQKRITTPAEAVARGSDWLVIGRPIRDARNPAEAALKIAQELLTINN